MNLSTVICCYNSSNRIATTLEYLAKQQLEGLSCEVILVDNNCSDETVAIAKSKWQEYGNPFPLKIIEEKTPGLSHARKAGVMEAKGTFLIFCDDDNWLEENYFRIAFKTMKEDETIGVLGGRGIAVSDVEFPFWFYSYQKNYAAGLQHLNSGYVLNQDYLWGAGMVIKKEVLALLYKSGYKSILDDRNGNNLSSGGDSEFCIWYLLLGYKLYYNENLIYHHFIDSSRLNKEYLLKLWKGFGEAYKIIKIYRIYIDFFEIKDNITIINRITYLIKYLLGKSNIKDLVFMEGLNSTNYVFNSQTKYIKSVIKKFKSLKV